MATVVQADLRPAIYTLEVVEAAAKAAAGLPKPLPVHLKVDTGMHRVGASPEMAVTVAEAISSHDELDLEGVWTHLAVADERGRDDYTTGQLERFSHVLQTLRSKGIEPRMVHAANSAGAIAHGNARLDLVRCGISLYGLAPGVELFKESADLRPALSLKAEVSYVKPIAAGEAVSYGLRWTAPRDTIVATVPIGYADGVPRAYGLRGGAALLGGERCPVVGTVTMDQLLVDCGPSSTVVPGDEVVLIGRQGEDEITAWEWAEKLGTIAYEVVCGISARVPRIYA
jgi:alanine racemase